MIQASTRASTVARASREHPILVEMLAVAELVPRPDTPTLVRKVPQPVQLRPDGVAAGAVLADRLDQRICVGAARPSPQDGDWTR